MQEKPVLKGDMGSSFSGCQESGAGDSLTYKVERAVLGKRRYPENAQKEEDLSEGARTGGWAGRIFAFTRKRETYMGVVQDLRQRPRGLQSRRLV